MSAGLQPDLVHLVAAEAACDLDRGYFDRHPEAMRYVRPALEHELCMVGPCRPANGRRVAVVRLTPDLRARVELVA